MLVTRLWCAQSVSNFEVYVVFFFVSSRFWLYFSFNSFCLCIFTSFYAVVVLQSWCYKCSSMFNVNIFLSSLIIYSICFLYYKKYNARRGVCIHTHVCVCARAINEWIIIQNTKKRNAHTKHHRFDARIGFDIILSVINSRSEILTVFIQIVYKTNTGCQMLWPRDCNRKKVGIVLLLLHCRANTHNMCVRKMKWNSIECRLSLRQTDLHQYTFIHRPFFSFLKHPPWKSMFMICKHECENLWIKHKLACAQLQQPQYLRLGAHLCDYNVLFLFRFVLVSGQIQIPNIPNACK